MIKISIIAILIKDLYCEICELQFDKKAVFNIHLSFVHGKNKLNIKEEVPLCGDKSINYVTDSWANEIPMGVKIGIHREPQVFFRM